MNTQNAMTLPCLTIQQPWAWAMFHGRTVENRTQFQSTYRGRLAIHASTRWSDRGGHCRHVNHAWKTATTHCTAAEYSRTSRLWTARGEIIGLVDLVDVHTDVDGGCCRPWGDSTIAAHGDGPRRRRTTHLVLVNPRALPEPIRCKGAAGLWEPPVDVTERLNAFDVDPAVVSRDSLSATEACDLPMANIQRTQGV